MSNRNNKMFFAEGKADSVLRFSVPVQFTAAQAAADGKPASLPKFSIHAYSGDAMRLEGSLHPVVVDLAGAKFAKKTPPVFLDHKPTHVVGHGDSTSINEAGIDLTGIVSGTGEAAREVVANSANGFPYEASIGFKVAKAEHLPAGKQAFVNKKTVTGPLLLARQSIIHEVSFVPIGADSTTSALITAQQAKGNVMDPKFKAWLEAKGIDTETLAEPAKVALEATYKAELTAKAAAGTGDETLDGVLNRAKQDDAKRKQIVDLTAKALIDHPGQTAVIEAMSRAAVEGSWEANRYELELLRATRPTINARGRTREDDGLTGEVLEAALCLSGGLEKPEDHFSEKSLEAASKRWKHGIGLVETMRLFSRRNGQDVSDRNVGGLLKAAFMEPDNRMFHADGVSTLSLSGILSNVANKFLKIGFESVETSWQAIAAKRPVKDFKTVTSYTLTGDFDFKKVAPGGDLKHAVPAETSYTNQATTYGRLFGVDRRDIINDDLGALTSAPRRLGRGAATNFNTVFWGVFLNNASFFSSGNANYFTGVTPGTPPVWTDTRLNIEGLSMAEVAFYAQTDPDGKPLGVMPRILLVPNALNSTASSLMKSTEIRDNTTSKNYGTVNPHAGKYEVVQSLYLSAAALTGYSSTAWYLLANPQDTAVIEVAFLNGVETPTIETADADFNTLGIQMRGYLDFGVALQEYRGGVKMKGAA